MLFAIVDEFAFFSECRNILSELQAILVDSERQESAKLFHNMEFTSPTGCFIYLGLWIPIKFKLKITHFCFNKTLRLLHVT